MKLLTILFLLTFGSLSMIGASLLGMLNAFKPVKYLAPVLLLGILLTSCDDNPKQLAEDGTTYRIETIDGCEYVYKSWGEGGVLSHKGNCKNPIHYHNKH